MRVGTLAELASGVDALYLSARAALTEELLARLQAAKDEAVATDGAIPVAFGGEDVLVAPHGFNKYRFSLAHPYGRIGVTPSAALPSLYVQLRAEFIHGAGPQAAIEWIRRVVEQECGPALLQVSRLDLFADFQGWQLDGDDRHDFVCRADDRATYESSDVFNGLQFGDRASGTVLARLYDKTIESAKSGAGYWRDIWGEPLDESLPVLRVEFQLGREALRQFGVNTPDEVLGAVGALWGYLTWSWLTHRVATHDETRTRWPVSEEWCCVQRAKVGLDDWGIARMYGGRVQGELDNVLPGLVGYLASVGALTGAKDFEALVPELRRHLDAFERKWGESLDHRIWRRRSKYGLP